MTFLITLACTVAIVTASVVKDAKDAAGDAVHSTVKGAKDTVDNVQKTANQAADCTKKGGVMGATGCMAGDAAKDTASAATKKAKNTARHASVAGHMSLKVAKKVTRRLQGAQGPQSSTGFAEDANAHRALKETVAAMANASVANVKVHTQLSPLRRLTADNVTDDIGVAYVVEAQNDTAAAKIHDWVSGHRLSNIEGMLRERLLTDGAPVYSVELTKNLVNLDTQYGFESFADDDRQTVQPSLRMDGVGSGLAGKGLMNAQSMDSRYPIFTFVGWGVAIGGLAGAVVVSLNKGKTKKKVHATADQPQVAETDNLLKN